MQPLFLKTDPNFNHSFYAGRRQTPAFPDHLMFHPEVEILLLVQGSGLRLISNQVNRFGPGVRVMIVKNINTNIE